MKKSFQVCTNSYKNIIFSPNKDSKVIYREHTFFSDHNEIDAHANYWTFGLFKDVSDKTSIVLSHQKIINFKGSIAIFMPPFSIVEWGLKHGQANWVYLLAISQLPHELMHRGPIVVFDVEYDDLLASLPNQQKIIDWIMSQNDFIEIQRKHYDHIVPLKLKSRIDENFGSSKTIAEMQDELNYSTTMSSRLFKKCYGLSPSDYRNQLRMKQASIELLFQGKTIENTLRSVGIEDSSHFHKCFRKYINGTPSQFRLPQLS